MDEQCLRTHRLGKQTPQWNDDNYQHHPATPIVGLMKMTTQKDDTIRTAYVVEDDGRRPDAIETSGGRGG